MEKFNYDHVLLSTVYPNDSIWLKIQMAEFNTFISKLDIN